MFTYVERDGTVLVYTLEVPSHILLNLPNPYLHLFRPQSRRIRILLHKCST
jgi:hypothetical protein